VFPLVPKSVTITQQHHSCSQKQSGTFLWLTGYIVIIVPRNKSDIEVTSLEVHG